MGEGGGPRRLTMADLAALAGVSKITVSRALKDSSLVRSEVRERIKEVAQANGYRLNTAARNLRLQRNLTITAAINLTPSADRSMSDPIFLGLLGGLLQVMTAAGYRLILTTPAELLSNRHDDSDSLIVLGQGKDEILLQRVSALGLPLIVWGTPPKGPGDWITIGSDNLNGGALIGRHLAELGRTDVLFLGDVDYPEAGERVRGLRGALAKDARFTVETCEFGVADGAAAVERAIAGGWRGDAVVGASDTIAMGAMGALQARGMSIPGDVSVIGYDGIEASAAAAIPLTTVAQDWAGAGKALGEAALALAEGEATTPMQLPVRLIVRESSGSAG